MSISPEVEIYQLRIYLRQISPMIWRRLLVRSDSNIADLHHTLQIAMGWQDEYLHQFIIHGKRYGVARIGSIGFADDPHSVPLSRFRFRRRERFLYEYNFYVPWQHEVRIEEKLSLDESKIYPVCIGGRRAAPPEDCRAPWDYLALKDHFSLFHIANRLMEIVELEERDDCYEELHDFQYWLSAHRFDRRAVNRRLRQYAVGDTAWQEIRL